MSAFASSLGLSAVVGPLLTTREPICPSNQCVHLHPRLSAHLVRTTDCFFEPNPELRMLVAVLLNAPIAIGDPVDQTSLTLLSAMSARAIL